MSTTYCTKADIEAIWPPASLLASVDDDVSGTLSATEEGYITRAIERAAGHMNTRLAVRYDLADLAASDWCRDANAAIAAFFLANRRGVAVPAHLQQQYDAYEASLNEIAAGRQRVPDVADSHDHAPSVTNFIADLSEPFRKAQRIDETST